MKKSLDSIRRAPVRQNSYEAPTYSQAAKSVPKEYQTFQRANKRNGGLIWIIFLLFLATVGGFIFWSTRGVVPSQEESLELSVTGPSEIVSGDQAVYKIKYKNLDKVPLEKMQLDVQWPSGFYFDKSSVEPHDSIATSWTLEDLPVGAEKEMEITGQLVGNKDEQVSALFGLSYQPQNFHSNFKAKKNIDTKITDSKLELSIEAVDQTLVTTEQEFKLKYKNISAETLTDLHLDILYPDDLALQSVDPTKDGDYWVFNLEPNAEKVITLKGNFVAGSKNKQLLVSEIGALIDNKFRRLARSEKNIQVVSPQFTLKLQINGKSENQVVNWGDTLRYQLEMTNDSESDLTNVLVTALIDGESVDWESLDTIGSRDGSKIVWSKDQNADLALWPVGQTRTLTWQLKVSNQKVAERNIENIIQINLQGLADWQQVSTPLTLSVGQGVSFNSGIYWHLGGRRVGSGIIPPKVGEETQYLAVWSINDATANFEQVVAQTTLPPGVSFESETDVPVGNLAYDSSKHTLTWTIDNLGQEVLPATASFMITLVPTEDQRGSAPTLFNPITIAAKGSEDLLISTKSIKTTDVVANTSDPIGIVE